MHRGRPDTAPYAPGRNLQRVAILARDTPQAVEAGISGYADEQKRVLSATVGNLRLVCAYVPNGQSLESDKYRYKLDWLAAFDAGWTRN